MPKIRKFYQIFSQKQKMKNALQLELGRIRNLKRALEAEIELLRSDTEQGKIHLRVNRQEEFRVELAKAIVDSESSLSSLGYEEFYYIDPVDGIVYKKAIGKCNPWSESVDWRIVQIENLFPKWYDFSPDIEDWSSMDVWDGCPITFIDLVKAFLKEKGEELEEDGEIPEWVWNYKDDIVSLAFESDLAHHLQGIEDTHKQRAIDFAQESILDEVIVELF